MATEKPITYAALKAMREQLVEEMQKDVPLFTLEHHMLIEMRLQTCVLAGITKTKDGKA